MNMQKNENQEQINQQTEPMEAIKDFGSVQMKNSKGTIHVLTIAGEIEGHQLAAPSSKTTKYEHVLPILVSVEQDEAVDALLVMLNTVGGDVEAGLAIAELIASMTKPVATLVLGGGHSIGVPLAVSGSRSFIASTATMTVHPVRMNGSVIGAEQTFAYFRSMQKRITEFVVAHSKISEKKFTKLMMDAGNMANDVGTILSGEEAVSFGLIDEKGGLDIALSYLYNRINENKL